MNRNQTIIAAAAVILLAALLGFFLLWQPKPSEPTTAAMPAVPAEAPAAVTAETPAEAATSAAPSEPAKTAEPMASAEPAQQAAPATAPAAMTPTAPTATVPAATAPAATATPTVQMPSPAPAQTAALVPPAFDVVRVEPNGEAVIAGRAMVGSHVSILDSSISLGGVATDGRGQWVFVVNPPLTPGGHELSLEARLADGRVVASTNVVVVNVPLPQIAAAPQASPQPMTAATDSGTKLSPAPDTAEKPLAVLMPRTGQGTSQVLQQSVSRQDGLAQGTLVLESIDYDQQGAIIGGRAEPGTRLIVYLDDIALGETIAGADGRWSLVLDRPLETGLHRLRVDAVDGQGMVIARVETPFSRASLAEALPDETSVIVQPGNSLWRIARRVYGEGVRYALIFEANQEQIRNPDLIYPGQIFKMPMKTPAAAPTPTN